MKIRTALSTAIIATTLSFTASAKTFVFSDEGVPSDPHIKGMEVFSEELSKLTNGESDVKVYHSAQLMNKISSLASIKRGRSVDFVYTGPNWIAEYVPYMSMFASSYLFSDYQSMTDTLNGPIGKDMFDDIAEKTGIRPLSALYLGTRQLNLRDNSKIIKEPKDLEGVTLRMPNATTWMEMARSLGGNPTPLAFPEVYMALKTGAIDGQDNPLPTDKNAKFYEVTKTIVLTDHYINPVFLSVNDDNWQAMSENERDTILAALEKAREYVDQYVLQQEGELVDFFVSEGLDVYKPNKDAFIEHARSYYKSSDISKDWDMDLYNKITNNQ
ncbi:DctP family TRAP transporter solute-binding subunit [Vibrio sp. MA40-2]|uniref:DctP family TRAP transporter solute-binding subunit n=1 Tax=Vibrio sp. MA40-2 TaxID=3391828 RepID=UPI0039A6E404